MKIIHRYIIVVTSKAKKDFLKVGVDLDENFIDGEGIADDFSSFSVDESSNDWLYISVLAKKYEATENISTSFTSKELLSAKYLAMDSKCIMITQNHQKILNILEKLMMTPTYVSRVVQD